MHERSGLTIGTLGQMIHTSVEKIGIPPRTAPPRTASNYRHYDVEHVRRLRFV